MFNPLGFASSAVLDEKAATSCSCTCGCSGVVSVTVRVAVAFDVAVEV